MKLRGRVESRFISLPMVRKQSTSLLLLHLLSTTLSCLSTGNLVFFYGVASHYKSLQTSASGTGWIMAKGGKCQFTMDRTV
uniref:Pco079304 n=1 Tax=Arundo donax TaxID=35708 RepID=A0A0A9HPC0_ARUDO